MIFWTVQGTVVDCTGYSLRNCGDVRVLSMKYGVLIFLVIVMGGSDSWAEPPATIDLNSKMVPVISSSVIPIPLEVFTALDKLGNQDWNSQLLKREFNPSPDRSLTALLFGLAISEGFVAVQAKNQTEVRRVGLAVQRLAVPLGIDKPVESRLKVLMESLDAKDWELVKHEFDLTRQTVLETMRRMRDEDLASLVALGGWLGGTGALSSMLKENYSPEGSDLLNQSGLLHQIKAEFNRLPASIKTDRIFSQIDISLGKLGRLMSSESGVFSIAQVSEIHDETQMLLEAICQN